MTSTDRQRAALGLLVAAVEARTVPGAREEMAEAAADLLGDLLDGDPATGAVVLADVAATAIEALARAARLDPGRLLAVVAAAVEHDAGGGDG